MSAVKKSGPSRTKPPRCLSQVHHTVGPLVQSKTNASGKARKGRFQLPDFTPMRGESSWLQEGVVPIKSFIFKYTVRYYFYQSFLSLFE